MTALTLVQHVTDPVPDLPGELFDALTEVVLRPGDAGDRSRVICALIREICVGVEWFHDHDDPMTAADEQELGSIRRLEAAAREHRWRMTADGAGSEPGGTS